MTRAEVEKKVIECFGTAYKKDPASISLTTNIYEELSNKSILMVGLVGRLEDELDILISLPDASKMKTVGDMVNKVCVMLSVE